MISNSQPMHQIITRLIRSRGGDMRIQIIKALRESPQNTNQLATHLQRSYKTIQYHIAVLEKNRLVTPMGDTYAITYFLSQPMEENYKVFLAIIDKEIDRKKKLSYFVERANPIISKH